MLNPEFFRQYDIRGIAGKDLEEEDAQRLIEVIVAAMRQTSKADVIYASCPLRPIKWMLTFLASSILSLLITSQLIFKQTAVWFMCALACCFLAFIALYFIVCIVFLCIDKDLLRTVTQYKIT